MQRTDIGMVQIRDGAGFAFKTPSGFEIYRNFRQKDFNRHPSAESNIFCPVHLAHAACAEKCVQAIGAEFGAGRETVGTRQYLTNGALAMLTDGVDPNVNRSVARSGSGFNERANSESGSEQTTKWVLSNADLVT